MTSDGKSKDFRKTFDDEAKINTGIFNFGAIDCDAEAALCTKEDIKQFPALKLYPPVPIPAPQPDFELDVKKLIRLATNYADSKVVEINDDNHTKILADNVAVPKVLLFTDKANTPLLYKSLSLAFDVLTSMTPEKDDPGHRPKGK